MCNKTKVIDCTLRDGGYYVDWDFSPTIVRKYLMAMELSKVEIVEIGFRSLSQEKYLGPYAYSTDSFISSLQVPSCLDVAVMVNASDLLNYDEGVTQAIYRMFRRKEDSPVNIVRIASRPQDVHHCVIIAKTLYELGYSVMLNLMQVDQFSNEELIKISKDISTWGYVDVLYFADSFGNLNAESVRSILKILIIDWSGKIGFHAHDNKSQALSNCLLALKHKVSFLDATVLGMGRGAGNARTENLLVEMNQYGYSDYFPDAVFPLVQQEFSELKKKYKWGYNLYYFLSAVHGIHPTYIQEMLNGELYDTEQILAAIEFLGASNAPLFNNSHLLRAVSGVVGDENGEWDASAWVKGSEVLIIASGPSVEQHLDAIKGYISERKPVVFCLNAQSIIPIEFISAYIACQEVRILIESDIFQNLEKPLIIPSGRLPDIIKDKFSNLEVLDFGLRIEKNSFEINSNGCVLDDSLSLFYAISIATIGGAEKISFVGVDGYTEVDPRYKKICHMFDKYQELSASVPLQAITPTIFPIAQKSIYDPNL